MLLLSSSSIFLHPKMELCSANIRVCKKVAACVWKSATHERCFWCSCCSSGYYRYYFFLRSLNIFKIILPIVNFLGFFWPLCTWSFWYKKCEGVLIFICHYRCTVSKSITFRRDYWPKTDLVKKPRQEKLFCVYTKDKINHDYAATQVMPAQPY